MTLFGSGNTSSTGFSQMGGNTLGGSTPNPMKDVELPGVPDDSVSKIAFSPNADYLLASAWDNTIRCWEITKAGPVAKASQSHTGPILDCCWTADGTRAITAGSDKVAKLWDLGSNQTMDIAMHEQPIKTVHWIQGSNYTCVMTGSWDKTLKFWDTRTPNPVLSFQLQERCYCADVVFPMAVIGQANRSLSVYNLENQPSLFKPIESPLKYQHRCVSIFCDKNNKPHGFALGSIEGRVAIHYMSTSNPGKDNFTFKCHRSNPPTNPNQSQDIYAVNDIAFHPHYGTLATVGSDGKFSFWDKDARTKLKTSEAMEQPIVSSCFNYEGTMFAYAVSYDWSKGHEKYLPQLKNYIFLRKADDDLKPRNKKK